MIVYEEIVQGSDDWYQVRAGKPTASCFDKLITPLGEKSKQMDGYANLLVAERMIGNEVRTFEGNAYTERGKELEAEAAAFYELLTEIDLHEVGFVSHETGAGCSPDRFVGEEGLLEIKCPAPHTHIDYLLNDALESKYIPQIQGQLFITGKKWCDWMSYHPQLPPVIVRVERDTEYISKLEGYIQECISLVNLKLSHLEALGLIDN